MTLPTFDCPVCRNTLTIETVFAHQGVRDAIQALVDAHTDAAKLLRPLLGYVGLFAPIKTTMRYERIAALLHELIPGIRSASLQANDRLYVVPMDYWRQAMEEMLSRRDASALRLPLKNHAYLEKILVGYCEKAESRKETVIEKQRAGHSGFGNTRTQISTEAGPVKLDASLSKTKMPEHVKEALKKIKGDNDGNKKA